MTCFKYSLSYFSFISSINKLINLHISATSVVVFVKEDGTYVGTDLINYPFKIIHNELGLTKCRFYDLRGSYATTILKNGTELRDVADILGHNNVETTENYYISSTNDSRKETTVIFDNVMNSDVINKIIKYEV